MRCFMAFSQKCLISGGSPGSWVHPADRIASALSIKCIDHARPKIFREVSCENLGTNSSAARSAGACLLTTPKTAPPSPQSRRGCSFDQSFISRALIRVGKCTPPPTLRGAWPMTTSAVRPSSTQSIAARQAYRLRAPTSPDYTDGWSQNGHAPITNRVTNRAPRIRNSRVIIHAKPEV
jgi:hypothetical protein